MGGERVPIVVFAAISHQCFAIFEQYQKSRLQFVQAVASLASSPQNTESLQSAGKRAVSERGHGCPRVYQRAFIYFFVCLFVFAGVVSLLKPLMLDVVPSIQQTAALALGRLAEQSPVLAEAVVEENILSDLIRSHMGEQNVSRGWGE